MISMQMHDVITHMAASLGVTFDAAYMCTLFFAFACVGGFGFISSLSCDLGYCVLRAVRRLFHTLLRSVRRLLTVHFQKH